MKIYVRKILNHDITHEVSVTTSIVKEFFDGKISFDMIGKKTNEKGVVTINSATDPRFGGDFKQLLRKEGDVSEGDIVLIYKYQNHYVLDIITEQDEKYESIIELCKEDRRHTLIYGEEDFVIDSDDEFIIVEDLTEEELGRKLKEYYDSDDSDKVTGIYLFGIKYGKLISQKNYNKKNIITKSGINESYYAELNKAINISQFAKVLNGNERYIIQEFDEIERLKKAYNKIVYGIPGCGKSYYVEYEIIKKDTRHGETYRTTFYPDYTNSDFIGQIIPKLNHNDETSVLYDIQSGPFTDALLDAILHPDKYVYLVVEEINRGNAAAIFGDTFQLLDRNQDGESEYSIKNYIISTYLHKEIDNKYEVKYDLDNIKIPSNMIIIGTMNTSDQNVFTLDTAFKRRWKMEYIQNKIRGTEIGQKIIPGTIVKWEEFILKINDFITSDNGLEINGEDKQIGAYFISNSEWDEIEIMTPTNTKEAARIFAEKVLSYLWEDVAKINRESWFDISKYKTFESLVEGFVENGVDIFNNSSISFTRPIDDNRNN